MKVDKVYNITCTDRFLCTGNNAPYPNFHLQRVPVKVIEEYERYFVCEVLPHYTVGIYFDISKPYKITIDKWDLYHGDIWKVKEVKFI